MMVKPGMPYLDVVRQLRDNTTLPIRYATHTHQHCSDGTHTDLSRAVIITAEGQRAVGCCGAQCCVWAF